MNRWLARIIKCMGYHYQQVLYNLVEMEFCVLRYLLFEYFYFIFAVPRGGGEMLRCDRLANEFRRDERGVFHAYFS